MQKENKVARNNDWRLASMTGLGHARVAFSSFNLEIIMKSVNSKGLDLKVRSSRELYFLEAEICQMISKTISRGRVEVGLNLELFEPPGAITFDHQLAADHIALLTSFAANQPVVVSQITLGDLLKASHLWKEKKTILSDEELRLAVNEGLALALKDFEIARNHEGELLTKPLKESINLCRSIVRGISERSEEDVKKRFLTIAQRIKDLFASLEIDSERVYQECALLAERSDFKEEIDRLAAHIEHFSRICNEGGLKGRKLDFLCQEMLRESNTLLTKAGEHDVMTKAIDLKSEIERIREQVQNIE